MAASFFALLDDVALLMDDVATIGKVAAKKTAGILADDLAVNAEKASGFISSRELPVLWKITKGSLLNKAIILPIAFLLSAYLPIAITIMLLIGGLYLGFEGAEKIYHYLAHLNDKTSEKKKAELTSEEAKDFETKKVKSAVFIDFILSVEIVIIALSTVMGEPIDVQIPVVTGIALLATVGVYGLVAIMVRIDDFGLKLITLNHGKKGFLMSTGMLLIKSLPIIIRTLTVLGTVAMVLVAGGIYVHNVHFIHDLVHALPSILGELIVGLVVGFAALLVYKLVKLLLPKKH
ncbi:MAG: DUF808 domain-containing protein [Bacteroidetes bacterium]|nr:DUF808 domain-containing protein [Bacteroidota bacterium]